MSDPFHARIPGILIVDDDSEVARQAGMFLADGGYKTFTALSGAECLETYRRYQKEIHVVLLDYKMPLMQGDEVFENLQLINPRVAVVLSSGFAEHEAIKKMLSHGLIAFLPKPYLQQTLIKYVGSIISGMGFVVPSPEAVLDPIA